MGFLQYSAVLEKVEGLGDLFCKVDNIVLLHKPPPKNAAFAAYYQFCNRMH